MDKLAWIKPQEKVREKNHLFKSVNQKIKVMQVMLKQCVGIDISKANFHAFVCSMYNDQRLRFSEGMEFDNNKKGFNQLLKWVKKQLDKRVPVVYLMEATGVYYESLAYHLHKIKKTVHVVLPNTSKHYLASLNLKTKTDKVDAKALAQFGVERKHRAWEPPRAVYRSLKELTRYRTGLQDSKTVFMNQLSAFKSKEAGDDLVEAGLQYLIKQVGEQVKLTDQSIKKLVKQDEELKRNVKRLTSIKGIGFVSATVILAETAGFDQFKSIKQLVSFAGLDVIQRQSGSSVRGKSKISKKGNSHIRRALYFPGMVAVKHSTTFRKLYERHLDNKKEKMVALVAVQRKLLALSFTLWKNEATFIDNYQSIIAQKEVAPAWAEATQDSV